jgi:hypothetical protein
MTDQWRARDAALRQIFGMEHRTVNHSRNFVNLNDPDTHTQRVEGFWSHSKGYFRLTRGIKQDEHYEYLLQFLWAYQLPRQKLFNHLLLLFKKTLDNKFFLIFFFDAGVYWSGAKSF